MRTGIIYSGAVIPNFRLIINIRQVCVVDPESSSRFFLAGEKINGVGRN